MSPGEWEYEAYLEDLALVVRLAGVVARLVETPLAVDVSGLAELRIC